jgi:hypothetical protein
MRNLADAEHEASHVVVGLALKLKLKEAKLHFETTRHEVLSGYTLFHRSVRRPIAFGIMYAAGIAWEKRPGGNLDYSDADFRLARECLGSVADVQTGIRVAAEILRNRKLAHRRVAEALCDRDLCARDVARLVRGDD